MWRSTGRTGDRFDVRSPGRHNTAIAKLRFMEFNQHYTDFVFDSDDTTLLIASLITNTDRIEEKGRNR